MQQATTSIQAMPELVGPGPTGSGWSGPPATAEGDLLGIDELGYMELDKRGAELLFQVLTEREEKNRRHRLQRIVLRLDDNVHRTTTLRRHRGSAHLRRQHHRNRHRLLPTRPHPSSAIRLIHTRWVRITPPIGLE
ncbi:hypothetical protein RER_36270 [Rhodococcus erythropolis PR4]|uniref:Uncharacterized protein n=1 Tax=Rhodococcus erythropolis (strain PR4 / NBRC 100887) TaxID=234621 RepID=C1A150_RHOE4|nr:hypothetical protein RER_36270 [Rhodococcus erythropolis PR4]